MQTLERLLALVRISVSVALLLLLCLLAATVRQVIAELPERLDRRVELEAQATRELVRLELAETRGLVDRQVTTLRRELGEQLSATRTDLKQELGAVVRTADARLAAIQADLDRQLSRANQSVAQVASLREEVRGLAAPAQNTLEVLSENADLLGRCEHNPDCFANRAIGVMQATERTMRSLEQSSAAVAKATPDTAEAVRSTAKSVQSIANAWEKQTPFYVRALGWLGDVFIKFKALF